ARAATNASSSGSHAVGSARASATRSPARTTGTTVTSVRDRLCTAAEASAVVAKSLAQEQRRDRGAEERRGRDDPGRRRVDVEVDLERADPVDRRVAEEG